MTLLLGVSVAGCGAPALLPLPGPTPLPPAEGAPAARPRVVPPSSPPVVAAAVPTSARVLALPSRVLPTSWRVTRTATVVLEGTREGQRSTEEALVTLQWEREATGWLRGRGTVTGYRLATSALADSAETAPPPVRVVPSLALLLVVDSGEVRVVPDPPLVTSCDREEMTAAQLAGVAAVRIPDGVGVGSRWEERRVGVECRAGVPVQVQRLIRTHVVRWEGDTVSVEREVTVQLAGRGGRPFEVVRVDGSGEERQALQLSASRGVVTRGSGRGVVQLTVQEGQGPPARLRQELRWEVGEAEG